MMDLHEQVRGLGQGLCGMITGTEGILMKFPSKKIKQTLKMSCIITCFVCVMYLPAPLTGLKYPSINQSRNVFILNLDVM